MSGEGSWVLKGVDPQVREKAVAEAARLGMNLGDYLTDVVIKSAIADQLSAGREDEPPPSEADQRAIFAPAPGSPEGFAIRQRLKALERRLSTASSSLDSAVAALDTSLFDVTARVGEVEALAGDTAHALGQTQQEMNNTFTGIQVHLAVIEDNLTALGHVQDERATGIETRVGAVEQRTESAERSISILADAHEALKHAVAEDFSAFAHETTDRLGAGLAEVRAAADAAAAQADAAVEHLVAELRGVREVLEQRLADSAAETRARMHAAFAEAGERMASLSDRITDNERFAARVSEQLRAQIVDAEDGAQTALEETANALRAADAALSADISRAAQAQAAALETARAGLAAEIVAVREDQMSLGARLRLVDGSLSETVDQLSEFRETTERRMAEAAADARGAVQRAQAQLEARLDGQSARISEVDQGVARLAQTLTTEIERVETAMATADAGLEHRIELAAQGLAAQVERARDQAAGDINLLREEHAGALARLTLLDGALNRLEAATAPLEQRLAELEHAAANAETTQTIMVLRGEVAALAARLEALEADSSIAERINALQVQLEGHGTQTGDLGEQVEGVARMLNRVAAQAVENAAKTDERAHQIELALADLRLSHIAAAEKGAPEETVRAFEDRLLAMEQRQRQALETLRGDIARFVADNDRRLADLEAPDERDLAAEFDVLRARIEERIIGVETRSIRTLEQVADTVAMIEQRFMQAGGEDTDKATRSA